MALPDGMDPSLLEDFLAESNELIEQLDTDLVILEAIAQTDQAADLLNEIFRALHTIKGAASFLNLTAVTEFAHAAEGALNKLRNAEVAVSASVMDVMLRSVDVLRHMLEQLADDVDITPGPRKLIAELRAIADGPADEHDSTQPAPHVDPPDAAPRIDQPVEQCRSDAAQVDGADAREAHVEKTIRVDVRRLEDLLNLVGELVLTKNRLLAMSRRLGGLDLPHEFSEDVATIAGDLDRLTAEMQVSVMRTRMQPLAKLFDRYPRVIRDIARATNKNIELQIVGRETEVDKSVLELLADPLVHILRNSADHGIETCDMRTEAGKPQTGHIRLTAEHQGGHVRLEICDDGKGLDRDLLGAKAVERGLASPDQLQNMSDDEVFRFIFEPGFSTAANVSDLSGRGVGMDVVRSNVAKMNGTINLNAAKGRGTTIEILIPLTVAILPAMMVGIGRRLYAIPLQSVVEIVRPDQHPCHTIHGSPVIQLRDAILPLLDMRQCLEQTDERSNAAFAVVVGVGNQQTGLLVDALIGQQDIVIKPLDDGYTHGGPFSGATIRDDGNVSLILDVVQLIRHAQSRQQIARRAVA